MDNRFSPLILEVFKGINTLSFISIFTHFGFKRVSSGNYNSYLSKKGMYRVYHTIDGEFTCFDISSFQEFNKVELLILLTSNNDLQHLNLLIAEIKNIPDKDPDTKQIEYTEAISLMLGLQHLPIDFSLYDIPSKVFQHPFLSQRIYLRGEGLCFPLSYQNKMVNLMVSDQTAEQSTTNTSTVGSWSTKHENGNTKFILFTSVLELLSYCSTHSGKDSFALLVMNEFPDCRLLETMQWVHKNGFNEIILPYSKHPYIFGLRIFCQLVNLEIPRLSINLEMMAQTICISFKSSEADFATAYSSLLSDLNKTARQSIKKNLSNPLTYADEIMIEKYFLFNSENRSLSSKNLKCLTFFKSPANCLLVIECMSKIWKLNVPLKYVPLI